MNEDEVIVRTLKMAAEHLEKARQFDWASRERKINGWASAAAELRRMAGTYENRVAT